MNLSWKLLSMKYSERSCHILSVNYHWSLKVWKLYLSSWNEKHIQRTYLSIYTNKSFTMINLPQNSKKNLPFFPISECQRTAKNHRDCRCMINSWKNYLGNTSMVRSYYKLLYFLKTENPHFSDRTKAKELIRKPENLRLYIWLCDVILKTC